ncbi:MAG: UDP-glucose 4-epimerase GalE [Rhodospirillaceae bacterium]
MTHHPTPTILVTGGAGYVGSHCCAALARLGFRPVVYDNLTTGHAWAVQWGPLEVGDVRDAVRLREVFRNHKPDLVMHFAALSEVGASFDAPERYFDVNVRGTQTLLQVMAEEGCAKLVFSSTCALYDTASLTDGALLTEDTPLGPLSPYGATKMAAESLIEAAEGLGALQAFRLRYFNAAGADPLGRIGEAHSPETHLIPLILQVALGQRKAISLFGTDYPTADGTCIRDYVHVNDLGAAHGAAARFLLQGGPGGQALNLGCGEGHSVQDVINAVRRVTGHAIPVLLAQRRAGDPARLVADTRMASRVLGWSAERSDLLTIIHDAWGWHQTSRAQDIGSTRGFSAH